MNEFESRVSCRYFLPEMPHAKIGSVDVDVMEENNAVLRQQTDTAATFINETLKGAKERMDALETQISQFKAANMGRLPEQYRLQLVTRLHCLSMSQRFSNSSCSRAQRDYIGRPSWAIPFLFTAAR